MLHEFTTLCLLQSGANLYEIFTDFIWFVYLFSAGLEAVSKLETKQTQARRAERDWPGVSFSTSIAGLNDL
jgi:hypothetical protein